MITDKNTGGPAFPAPAGVQHITEQGMTLRDYFAAKAMQAMLASPELMVVVTSDQVLGEYAKQRIAKLSYKYADAMLKAREQ